MIEQAVCRVLRPDLFKGVHQPSDVYRLALYTDQAALDAATEGYTTEGEVKGQGYIAGGVELTGYTIVATEDEARFTFDAPAVWRKSTIRAAGALLYNASRNRALGVIRFSSPVTSTNGTFRVTLPADLFTIRSTPTET